MLPEPTRIAEPMTTKVSKVPVPWSLRLIALLKRRELWLLVGGALLLVPLLWWLSEPVADLMAQAGELRSWILTFGPLSPLVYIGVFSLQILVAPLPGQFLGIMGGYLFGAFLGSLYSLIGLVVGAGLAIGLTRRFGRPLLQRFFDPVQLAAWEKKMRMRSGFTWWLLFLFPVPDLVFYVAGLSSMSLRTLLIAVVAGRGLGLFFANTLGQWTANTAPEWVLVKWSIVGLLASIIYLNQRQFRLLALLTARRLRRWSNRYSH
jgi:uncharacterized membrane protein YdjX (TVP38/TMEM64 family)